MRGEAREVARAKILRGRARKDSCLCLLVNFLDISFPGKCVNFSDYAVELRADLSHLLVRSMDV